LCADKASDAQGTDSACNAVGNGLSDAVLRLQSEPKKHVSVPGMFRQCGCGFLKHMSH